MLREGWFVQLEVVRCIDGWLWRKREGERGSNVARRCARRCAQRCHRCDADARRSPAHTTTHNTHKHNSYPYHNQSDLLSSEESRRIAELRRLKADAPAPAPSSNVIQGALEEAQLITWPKPGKALLDTVLVLAIVAGTGTALFGVNVALTDVFNWWYSH